MFCWICWELWAPKEFTTTKEGCGRKFLVCRILCVYGREKKDCLFQCVRNIHFAAYYKINRNISKSPCTWNGDKKINNPVFIWLEMKKLNYLLILTGGVFSFIWSPAGIFKIFLVYCVLVKCGRVVLLQVKIILWDRISPESSIDHFSMCLSPSYLQKHQNEQHWELDASSAPSSAGDILCGICLSVGK